MIFFLLSLTYILRIMVAIMTGIGILWIPVVQNVQGGQLFLYIQAVSAYFSPPIAALYLIAILWTKATEKVCYNAFLSTLQRVSTHTINTLGARGFKFSVRCAREKTSGT